MSENTQPLGEQQTAQALGLKVPVYQFLRQALEAGEHPVYLELAAPEIACVFPNPLGFELLLDRMKAEESVLRRRANLASSLQSLENEELQKGLRAASDEGELEDYALAGEASTAPQGSEAPEKEAHQEFLTQLRGDWKVALALRTAFRVSGMVKVDRAEGKEKISAPFNQFEGQVHPLQSFPVHQYLTMRRGEHNHSLAITFELGEKELVDVFEGSVQAPPQERDSYLELFRIFFKEERLPRLIQEARARLKRSAENLALEQAWDHAQGALDRGRKDAPVLGVYSEKSGKTHLALVDASGTILRCTTVQPSSDEMPAALDKFIGEDKPVVVALQADSPTRNHGQKIADLLKKGKQGARPVLVPVGVVRTMLREVARRMEESHLKYDERHALMLARFGHSPREAVLHTPHIARSFVANRSEVNQHRLDSFERFFVHSLLTGRGVDPNSAPLDELRLVPGLDERVVEVERSTGAFRSLEDLRLRLGLEGAEWNAAACFLRIRSSEEPLDGRPLHPLYYSLVYELLEKAGLEIVSVLKEPKSVKDLDWESVVNESSWGPKVPQLVQRGLEKGTRRYRRPGRSFSKSGGRLESLEVGARLKGKVANVVEHGAFIDLGLRKDGFAHVSQLADQFVKDPSEVVSVGQEVEARVVSIDLEKQRFRVSLRSEESEGQDRKGGKGKGKGRGKERESRKPLPAHAKDMRPKSRPGGVRGGRDDDRRGGKKKDKISFGKDPQAGRWKE
ncbi:MAG: S1 RNA-binding domain-containing protein [Planctomycetes bacterium]|nr:S1 RNA-binding domain-containing protein [Planctomycetota bacterium]